MKLLLPIIWIVSFVFSAVPYSHVFNNITRTGLRIKDGHEKDGLDRIVYYYDKTKGYPMLADSSNKCL